MAEPDLRSDETRRSLGEQSFWQLLGRLYRRRWLIVAFTGTAAVLSVVISLLLPNWYRASSRLLLPDSGGSGIAGALLGDLGSAAQSLLGSSGGDYVRYLAILTSRTVAEEVVETFDLIDVYELSDSETPMEDAIEELVGRTYFVVDDEFDFLSVEVEDLDPQRAADLANYYIQALDRVNNELNTRTAGNFRAFVETRYGESQAARGALLDSLRAFQSTYGVYDLTAQTQAFFDQLAEMRVQALQAEIQYEAARDRLGEANSRVAELRAVVDAANRKYQAALSGRERILPVDQSKVPDLVRAFAEIEMERTIQERILEFIAPMLEQARFEEKRQSEAVQVVDSAVAPVDKSRPKRSTICVTSTLSAFILIVLYVLATSWWAENHRYYARRLREAAEPVPARD